MSLGRTGLAPVDDATIHVDPAEVEIDSTPEPGGTFFEPTPHAAGAPRGRVTVARLLAQAARGRVLGPLLTRLMQWLGDRTAHEVRREYLSRLELAAYQHGKELARAQKEAREHEARADAKTLEVEFLTTLHARTMARMESETLAYGAAGKALTNRSDE